MRNVKIIGTGMVPFGRFPHMTLTDYAYPAVVEAIKDAGIDKNDIAIVYAGASGSGQMPGQKILRNIGISGIPVLNVENACSSGSSAFYVAMNAIKAGTYDVALVIGVDMLSKFPRGPLPIDGEDWEASHGLFMPALYAMRAQRYMHENDLTEHDLSLVSVKARRHGAMNPLAHLQKEVTLEEVATSRMTSEPLRQLHCCPVNDGAAAFLVASEDYAKRNGIDHAITVAASVLHSGDYTTGFRDMTSPEVTVESAREAYEAAGIGPEDLDLTEIHDAFASAELMYYDALGLSKKGEAAQLIRNNETTFGGKVVVNPSGGLLSRGHPVGATGAAQIVEVVRQLQGRRDKIQVDGAKVGLSHATGGGVSGYDHGICSISIFKR